jgi:hypothetical protein
MSPSPASLGANYASSMFESRKSYEWKVPAPIREAGVTYWRTVALAWTMPWFVMAIRWSAEDAIQTFLISNDSDLSSALQSIKGRGVLESLACCLPNYREPGFAWSMIDIDEVWLGRRLSDSALCTVFVDRERRTIIGSSLEQVPGIALTILVARVGEVVHSPLPADIASRQPSA